jgi:NAD(P)-dependent dehydrogenase (short-subunit alcohol dehydrogenase family)
MSAGRTAVITGAASGIGLASALRLGSFGMNVVLADLPGPRLDQALQTVRAALPAEAEAIAVQTDVSDLEAVKALKTAALERFNDVAVLMNNAGAAPGGGPFDHYEGWSRVLGINLWGVINGVHSFTPEMIAHGRPAAIINTGSKQGITAPPGDTAYNVSKAGVKVLTEGLAHQLRNLDGCQVTAHLLVPGFVWTGMTARRSEPGTEKPAGAWTPEETVAFMIRAVAQNQFYVLCPDNETTTAMDRKRIAWAAGDLIENRPALSRWHKDYKAAFDAFMAQDDGP